MLASIFMVCAFAEFTINLNVDQNKIFTDEYIKLSITVSGESQASAKISLPELDFLTFSKNGQSSQTSFINGIVNRSISYNYIIRPIQTGNFSIPPIKVIVNGKLLQTKPLKLTFLNLKERKRLANSSNLKSEFDKKNLKIQLKLSKNKVYVDEPVILDCYIYKKMDFNFQNPEYSPPSLIDFISEDANTLKDRKNVNGIDYDVTIIQKILYPLKSGVFEIGPAILEGDQLKKVKKKRSSRSRHPFDSFFEDSFFQDSMFSMSNIEAYPLKIYSNISTLTVNPIPENAPDNFSGTVGNYKMNVSYSDLGNIKQGDAITLTIEIRGDGHIESVKEPLVSSAEGFKVFESEISLKPEKSSHTIGGIKTFKKMMILKKSGTIKLPDIQFSYFNIKQNKFQILSHKGINIEVKDNEENKEDQVITALTGKSPDKKELKILGQDIIFLNTEPSILKPSKPEIPLKTFISILIIILSSFTLFLFLITFQQNKMSDPSLLRRKAAYKNFKKELKKLNTDKNTNLRYGNLNNLLSTYLSAKFNYPEGTWTVSDISSKLENNDLSLKTSTDLKKYIEKLDMGQFGMSAMKDGEWKQFIADVDKTLKSMESLKS